MKEIEKSEKKYRHLLSHQQLNIRFEIYKITPLTATPDFQKIKLNTDDFPGVPQVIMKLLKNENWFRKI